MPVDIPGFLGGDRTSLDLPASQVELLHRIQALGKPVIVILTTGSAISMDAKNVDALLLPWYSGEQGGNAVANTILGESNPAGRLPVTFYKSVSDLPPFQDYHMTGRTYRYFKGKPLFPFGFGLSYSKFDYGKASIASAQNGYTLTVPVKNTSNVAGDEVVEVYARYDNPQQNDPIHKLVGFKRVSFQAGEQKDVTVDVTNWALRYWNDQTHAYEVRPGSYTIEVGPSSDKVSTQVNLKI
jgi:beta-glucosidase